jgi:hypothetical protein
VQVGVFCRLLPTSGRCQLTRGSFSVTRDRSRSPKIGDATARRLPWRGAGVLTMLTAAADTPLTHRLVHTPLSSPVLRPPPRALVRSAPGGARRGIGGELPFCALVPCGSRVTPFARGTGAGHRRARAPVRGHLAPRDEPKRGSSRCLSVSSRAAAASGASGAPRRAGRRPLRLDACDAAPAMTTRAPPERALAALPDSYASVIRSSIWGSSTAMPPRTSACPWAR